MILNFVRKLALGMPLKKVNISKDDVARNNTFAELAQTLIQDLDLETMCQNVVDQMINSIGSSGGVLFLNDENNKCASAFTVSSNPLVNLALKNLNLPFRSYKYDYSNSQNYVGKAIAEKKIFESNKLSDFLSPNPSNFVCNAMQNIVGAKYIIALPIINKEKVLGVNLLTFLEDKLSDENMQLLNLFNDFVAVAVANSIGYKKTIEQKDNLQSLYLLTSQITQSLDPQKVAQIAMNALPQDKTMVGAILVSYNATDMKTRYWAATQNALSKKVEDVIGDFNNYSMDVSKPEFQKTAIAKAILENSIQATNNLEDNFSPPIPKPFIPIIAKILNIKSVVTYPIKSRGINIGAVIYLLKEKEYAALDINEKQLLSTYTYQISIALENSILFNEAQVTQKNLETAIKQIQDARKHEQDMIDILGHELRTPATVTKGNLELLISTVASYEEGKFDKEFVIRKLRSGYDAILKETGIINELLAATKIDSGQFVLTNEQVDLYEIAWNTYQNYVDSAKLQDIEMLFLNKGNDMPRTMGDKVRLGEVIDNLFSNALKYTKQGSIKIWLEKDQNMIYFHIQDSGNGIKKQDLETLFKKFHRLNNYLDNAQMLVRPGGTGLGLYVAKGIIEAHGGKIWVESEGEGKGSTFSFALPIKTQSTQGPIKNEDLDMFKKLKLK